jgi:FeS assembly SUF system regulator
MLRISKLTDYALIILAEMQNDEIFSAKHISDSTQIPLATTNKILKLLHKANICNSKYGKNGGFILAKSPSLISILNVIQAIDEKSTSLTECANIDHGCQLKNHCKITKKMNLIDYEIHNLLKNKFISDLV